MKPPPKRTRRLEARRGEFGGSSETIEDQESKASTEIRRCHRCLWRVTNDNLGGHNGNSAISGPVFCHFCANPQTPPCTVDKVRSDLRQLRVERIRRRWLQLEREDAAKVAAEVKAIKAQFDHVEDLLIQALYASRRLRLAIHFPERQHALLSLVRECARDVTVLVHGLHQRFGS